MRAFAIDELGQPGSVRDLPDPVAGAGEVLVRVRAAAVNPWDSAVATGGAVNYVEHRFPLIPGTDAAGVVAATGPGVEGIGVGDEVIAISGNRPFLGAGTFGQLVVVAAEAVARKPSTLSFVEAATLPHAGLTALAARDAIEPRAGQVIVVGGATGSVGSFFTQLAAHAGATVVAIARSRNAGYARQLGAADVIDRSAGDPTDQVASRYPGGIDAVAVFGGDSALIERLGALLKPGDRIASSMRLDVESFAARGITATQANRAPLSRLPELTRLVEQGTLHAPAVEALPLEKADVALTRVAKLHTRGKIVLTID